MKKVTFTLSTPKGEIKQTFTFREMGIEDWTDEKEIEAEIKDWHKQWVEDTITTSYEVWEKRNQ